MSDSNSFQLVRYPDVMSKLRAEITVQCTENSALNRTDLRNLKYLQNVIKESKPRFPGTFELLIIC